MPQQSLLPEYPPMTSLTFEVRSFPLCKSPDQVDVIVKVSTGGGPLKTRVVLSLEHNERDYLNTLVSEATMAFMYGNRPKDVVIACTSVKRLARAHEASTSP